MSSWDTELETPIKVLYVNDSYAFTDLVCEDIETTNSEINCVTAECVGEALEILSSHPIDCVVTAYELPDRTGIDLIESIRAEDDELPVILLTEQGNENVATAATQADVTDYIPIRSDVDDCNLLINRIRTFVEAARDRKRASQLENRVQRTLERTTDAIYAVDTEWRIEYMNEQMAERVGRDPEAVIGANLWEEFPFTVGTELEEKYRTAIETGSPVTFEQHIGGPLDYWVQVRAFPDENGLTVFSHEITDERERKQELERNETVLKNIHDAVFVLDETSTIQFANAAAAQAFDRTGPDQLEGEQLKDIVGDAVSRSDIREFNQAFEEVLHAAEEDDSSATPYDCDLHFGLGTPLERRCFDTRLTPLQADGEPQVLVVARDVTEQKQLEHQLWALQRTARRLNVASSPAEVGEIGVEAVADILEFEITGVWTYDERENELVPETETAAAQEQFDTLPRIPPGESLAWEAFESGEVQYCSDVSSVDESYAHGTEIHSEIVVPLGEYGILLAATTAEQTFAERQIGLFKILGATVKAAMGRAEREATLTEQKQLLDTIFEYVPIHLFIKDREGRHQWMSRGLVDDPDQYIGKTDVEADAGASEEFSKRTHAESLRVIEQGEPILNREEYNEELDRWFLTSKVPRGDPDGEILGVLGYSLDITERKRWEKRLTETNTILSELLANLPVGVLVEDETREIIAANEALHDIIDLSGSPDDLVGQNCEAVAEDLKQQFADPEGFITRLEEILADQETVLNEELALADGRTVERSYVSYQLPEGRGNIWLYRDITEQKKRESELQRQEFLFDRVQEIAEIGIWEYCPKSEELRWSDGIYRIHGIDPEYEPTLEDVIEFCHPDDREQIASFFNQALEGQETNSIETRITRADGEVRDVRAWCELVEKERSGETVLRGVLQDITTLKEQERTLRQAHQQFRTFAENVDHAFFLVPPDYSEVSFMNSATEEMYGVTEQQLRQDPKAWLERIHPDDIEAVRSDIEAQQTTEAEWPQHQEFRIQHPERGVRWVRSRAHPITNDDGVVKQIASISTDVTSAEEYKRKLERLQQYTSRLIDASGTDEAAELGVEAATDILDVEFCGIHLQTGSELRQTAFTDATGLEHFTPSTYDREAEGDPVSSLVWDVFETGDQRTIDDINEQSTLADHTPVRSAIVHPLEEHGVVIVSSLSPDAFSAVDQTLVTLLGEALTGALTRIERSKLLRDRERELQKQNDRLEKFASIVSHDLRNPLSVARGYIELAEEKGEKEYFEKINSALNRMEGLIEDLLVLSKARDNIGDGTECPLNEIAREGWTYVETGDANLQIADETPLVYGECNLLTELFENLFRNAVEHGGEDVTVNVGKLDRTDGFYVEDNGTGIPPEKREDVFEYGYTTNQGGTGFGLAIVADIANAHGWSISLTASSEGGTRFEFETGA
ncbi:PAS domain S-box protein [Halogeometricum borinquense]|uniref:histidine kinase n=1 Tax=Halogeometricum borinquense TaxID=60847 RepID=A0A482SZS8_9EURY|nr:PAS domain-containing protein [Halogeometricum borinquense]RYJ08681.1 PAS domain S-box protein [Halogeometricum borinquense]